MGDVPFGGPEHRANHGREMAAAGEGSGGHRAHGAGNSDDDKITFAPDRWGDLSYRFENAGTLERSAAMSPATTPPASRSP